MIAPMRDVETVCSALAAAGDPSSQPSMTGLDAAEAHILSAWLIRARPAIDGAVDLLPRPWNVPGVRVLIGIFRAGSPAADWLVLRSDHGWLLLHPAEDVISAPEPTLAALLARFDPKQPR